MKKLLEFIEYKDNKFSKLINQSETFCEFLVQDDWKWNDLTFKDAKSG